MSYSVLVVDDEDLTLRTVSRGFGRRGLKFLRRRLGKTRSKYSLKNNRI
jgi:hypothetical protein